MAELSERQFFEEVLASSTFLDACVSQGLTERAVYGAILGRNAGLKLWKPSWTLPKPSTAPETVQVHLEARRRGVMQLDVEIYPYEGSIAKKPERLKALEGPLLLKSRILGALRTCLLQEKALLQHLGVTKKGLRNVSLPSTLGAVRFERGLGSDCSVSACAAFFAEIVGAVTPEIDEVLSMYVA